MSHEEWKRVNAFLSGSEPSLADFVVQNPISVYALHKAIYAGLTMRSLHLLETIIIVGPLPHKDPATVILARTMFELMLDSMWLSKVTKDNMRVDMGVECCNVRKRTFSYLERQQQLAQKYSISNANSIPVQKKSHSNKMSVEDSYTTSVKAKAQAVGKSSEYEKYRLYSDIVHGQIVNMASFNTVVLLYWATSDFCAILDISMQIHDIAEKERKVLHALKIKIHNFKKEFEKIGIDL